MIDVNDAAVLHVGLSCRYLSEPRQIELLQWLDVVVRVLLRMHASSTFAFAPDMLISIINSGYHALHENGEDVLSAEAETPYFAQGELNKAFLARLVQLMVAMLPDDRIKTPDSPGMVLGLLRAALSVPEYVAV